MISYPFRKDEMISNQHQNIENLRLNRLYTRTFIVFSLSFLRVTAGINSISTVTFATVSKLLEQVSMGVRPYLNGVFLMYFSIYNLSSPRTRLLVADIIHQL